MLRCKQNGAVTPTALTGEETRKIQGTALRASTAREQYHLSATRMVSHEIQDFWREPRLRDQKVADKLDNRETMHYCTFGFSWKTVGLTRVYAWTRQSPSETRWRNDVYSPKAGICL